MDRTPVPEDLRAGDEPKATQPQKDYILGLLDKKDLLKSPKFFNAVNAMDVGELEQYLRQMKQNVEVLTKKEASAWINRLLELPNLAEPRGLPRSEPVDIIKGRTKVVYETFVGDDGKERRKGKIVLPDGRAVLEGSYGVDTEDDERFTNNISFFRVWIAEGYGKGWGIKMYTSDYTHRVNLGVPTQIDVIVWIADDPLGAAKLFGHEFKRCGICYRGLTKDESRAAGIGPVCGARIGIHVY